METGNKKVLSMKGLNDSQTGVMFIIILLVTYRCVKIFVIVYEGMSLPLVHATNIGW